MNPHVIFAIFRRNFASYFSSPIGYVFICAFVLMSGFAAFWPNDFFNANLATLDQLNKNLPWIMLVFIPAITMSIWADEKRQGTDELLLTLPCTDLDAVVGKYLAALAIYTVALVFSFSNLFVLARLGTPDVGLLISNYIGYWLVGAAMISVGMVASFLTNSLTVSFVLALAFNAPLVFAAWADSMIPADSFARFIKSASIASQFDDFGKGLITLSGVVFFASITLVSLYLSMVLIGKRHWAGGAYGSTMAGHFTARVLALIAMVVGINVLANRVDARADVSAERVNSLSPQTATILKSIDTPRPVYVEAYISPNVPEEYVQTRLNLLSMLREAHAIAGDKVVVRVHDTPRFSEAEAAAETQFGIHPQGVQTTEGGKFGVDEITMGAAFICGLDKVVVPFFDRGIPVEYEIVRSIATVSQQKRKKIGILATDAKLYGGFDMESFSQRADQPIIDELKKQYDVVQVNADKAITDHFDALLAVQPSTLTAPQMTNFIAAVKSGVPTAIFEDPLPYLDSGVTPTSQPRQPRNRNPFMQQQQQPQPPKGDISTLWKALGIRFEDREVIYQAYNPYPKYTDLAKAKEFVFVSKGSGAKEPFNTNNPITNGLQQVLAVFAGRVEQAPGATTKFEPLAQTNQQTGTVAFADVMTRNFFGQGQLNPNRRLRSTGDSYVLAAHVTGAADNSTPPATTAPANQPMNVVVVSDIDMLYPVFFAMRSRGRDKNDPVDINLDNVTFVLNTLDYLAGDDRFIEIRKRRPAYRTLTTVEAKTKAARTSADDQREKFIALFENKHAEEQKKLDDKVAELKARQGIDPMQMAQELATAQQAGQNRLAAANEQLEKERDQQLKMIERNLAMQVRSVQDQYKLAAIALPPIPPLLVGLVFFFRRRSMEKIGVPKARLRT